MAHCPKCGGAMVDGFVLGWGGTSGKSHRLPHWAPGPPRTSFWSGVRVDRRTLIPVVTSRCERCGHLESWARPGTERG